MRIKHNETWRRGERYVRRIQLLVAELIPNTDSAPSKRRIKLGCLSLVVEVSHEAAPAVSHEEDIRAP